MAHPLPSNRPPSLPADFTQSLAGRLAAADRQREAWRWQRRLRRLLLVLLLGGPLLGWHLIATGHHDLALTIDVLTWLTFLLDVATRVDTEILRTLGLQFLPPLLGISVLVLVAAGLLFRGNER